MTVTSPAAQNFYNQQAKERKKRFIHIIVSTVSVIVAVASFYLLWVI